MQRWPHLGLNLALLCGGMLLAARASAEVLLPKPRTSYWAATGLGVSALSGDDQLTDGFHTGYIFTLRGGIALKSMATLKLSIGWNVSEVNVSARDTPVKAEVPQRINTNFADIKLSTLLALRNRMFAGASVMIPFGTDTSFAPTNQGSTTPFFYFGAQLGKHDVIDRFNVRYGVELLTDVNNPDRDITFVMAFIEADLKQRKKAPAPPKMNQQARKDVPKDYRYLIDAGVIHFPVSYSTLAPSQQHYLRELSSLLIRYQSSWDLLLLSSYTDPTGDPLRNRELSKERGRSVANQLLSYGIPRTKLKGRSYADKNLVTRGRDSASLARNRRVEILLAGQRNMNALKEAILRLQQRAQQPATCVGEDCI